MADAASHGPLKTPVGAEGESPLPSDPLQRLEVELGQDDGGQSSDERLYEEAHGLLEEAWSVLTECLGIRDGLLDACVEVEQAMSNMQSRLRALSVAIDAEGQKPSVGARPLAAQSLTLGANGNGSGAR